jgi:hypothetical protein
MSAKMLVTLRTSPESRLNPPAEQEADQQITRDAWHPWGLGNYVARDQPEQQQAAEYQQGIPLQRLCEGERRKSPLHISSCDDQVFEPRDPLHGSRERSRFSNDALGTLPVDVVTALSAVLDCRTFRRAEDITRSR